MAGMVQDALRWSVPSALTLGALVSGLSAVRFASEEKFATSVSCVMLAAVLDGLDGHVARYLEASTALGFELDSLCDCANFGVVPALVVYFWATTLPASDCRFAGCGTDHALLWAACCIYSSACALRLARFNVEGHAELMDKSYLRKTPSVPKAVLHNLLQRKLYFKGLPAPFGAAYGLTPMMLHFSAANSALAGAVGDVGTWTIGRRGTAITLLVTAVLMVSALPTLSSKMLKTSPSDSHLRSRGSMSMAAKVLAGLAVGLIFWHFPFDVILLLNLGHFLTMPFGVVMFYRFAHEHHD